MRVNLFVIGLLTATIISTVPVIASDGQLEINQACAVNIWMFLGGYARLSGYHHPTR